MEDLEKPVTIEGTPAFVQQHDQRSLFFRLRPEGFARHRVVNWLDSNCLWANEATFNRRLIVFFSITLGLTAINFLFMQRVLDPYLPERFTWDYIFARTWLYGLLEIRQGGIVLLAIFAAALTLVVVMEKKTGLRSARGEEVQTISALVQQV